MKSSVVTGVIAATGVVIAVATVDPIAAVVARLPTIIVAAAVGAGAFPLKS